MANANKRRGDRAEMAVRDYLKKIWPGTRRTRPGFDDDLGDVIAETPDGLLCVQVKDVATPQWKTWFAQLDDQVATLRQQTDKPVLGGVLVWKTRGSADPADWRVVSRLDRMVGLIGGLR